VIGDGPMAPEVAASLGERFLGFKPLEQVWAHLESASFLVVPSVWYEGFPRTIVEAYSCGVPVLASRLGSLAEVVEDGVTGLLFTPGDAHDLAAKMAWAKAHPEEMARMGRRAREVYEQRYTPQINGAQLESIYREVVAERCGSALGGARGTSPVIG
jgi:glycosyltransferase involved in cell wall biosynthesis